MRIRKAGHEDDLSLAPLVADLRVELAALRGRTLPGDPAAGALELAAYRAAGCPIAVAERSDGTPAGFLVCRVAEDVVWAEALYVEPSARRQGVARALYAEAERLACDHGQDTVYHWVHPENEAVVAFLRARGVDVLNLIELRGTRRTDEGFGIVRVGAQVFRSPQATPTPVSVRPLADEDRAWARALLEERWAGPFIVTRGRMRDASLLPAFVADSGGRLQGLATFEIQGDGCELVTLDAATPGRGVGTALLEAVRGAARRAGCRRLWLITTNDNVEALRFHQRRGFSLRAVHAGAVGASRRLKPGIPAVGEHGIPIRDEIELDLSP